MAVTLAGGLALAAALSTAAFGLARGTWAVGGSDSSCHALMAAAFAQGTLQPSTPLATEAPWPDAPRAFAPGGFVPSAIRADAAAPVCAPGFALVLAPWIAIGGRDAVFVVTPLAGAALVWLTFVFGRRFAGGVAGAAAAVVVATMPPLLFQVVQPMNDVTVAALWMAVLVAATRRDEDGDPARRAHAWSSILVGALAGLAVLVRPNLAPAAVVVALWWLWQHGLRASVVVVAAAVPFAAALAALNAALYGSVAGSGYGPAGQLFSLAHVPANLVNYGSALWQTSLGVPLLGAAAAGIAPRAHRAAIGLTLAVAMAVVGVYLLYRPYPEWWYLRFLLPALAPMTVLAVAVVTWALARAWVAPIAAAALAVFALGTPEARDAAHLWRLEGRFRATGLVARERLPDNAVFVTVWESGSIRYHAGREVLLWDALEPRALDAALSWLTAHGWRPYIVVERWEEPLFRERFAGQSAVADLDWPPRFDIDRQVRLFDPRDRVGYLAGERVPTEHLWTPR